MFKSTFSFLSKMKLSTIFFIFASIFLKVSCEVEDFKEINEKFQALNDELRDGFKTFIEKLEPYVKNVVTALEPFSNMTELTSKLSKNLDDFKALNFPFYDDLKSCDDLKLRNASTFPERNKFEFMRLDFASSWSEFMNILSEINKKYKKDKEEIELKARNFDEVLKDGNDVSF